MNHTLRATGRQSVPLPRRAATPIPSYPAKAVFQSDLTDEGVTRRSGSAAARAGINSGSALQ